MYRYCLDIVNILTIYYLDFGGANILFLVIFLKSNNSDELAQQSREILNKLSNMKNRELLHSIYPYAWELFSFIKKYREWVILIGYIGVGTGYVGLVTISYFLIKNRRKGKDENLNFSNQSYCW